MEEYTVRPYRPGEEHYVAEAHKRIYTQEYRWGEAFTSYAARIALDFAKKAPDPSEGLWIAEAGGRPVGCVMLCRTDEPCTGQLRLFLVEREYRCRGVGSALMSALLAKAGEAGYRRLILWTASPLTDAVRHYERLGFRAVERLPNTSWSMDGAALSEIKMELALRDL